MTKTRELRLAERHQIIGMFRAKVKKVAIAKEMGLGESTVRYVISKWLNSESVNSAPRSDRPSQLSVRDARKLVRTTKKIEKSRSMKFVINWMWISQHGPFNVSCSNPEFAPDQR